MNENIGRQVRVIKAYTSAFPNPLIMKTGGKLTIDRKRKTEWVGWLWCTNELGESGWFPEEFVDVYDGEGVLQRDYDSTELTVQIGETLLILDEASEWYWCEKESGERGWVPIECVLLV
jgi:hypothetical protein